MNPIHLFLIFQKIRVTICMWALFCIETVELYKFPSHGIYSGIFYIEHSSLSVLSVMYLSTSIAAMHPNPAAVIACR